MAIGVEKSCRSNFHPPFIFHLVVNGGDDVAELCHGSWRNQTLKKFTPSIVLPHLQFTTIPQQEKKRGKLQNQTEKRNKTKKKATFTLIRKWNTRMGWKISVCVFHSSQGAKLRFAQVEKRRLCWVEIKKPSKHEKESAHNSVRHVVVWSDNGLRESFCRLNGNEFDCCGRAKRDKNKIRKMKGGKDEIIVEWDHFPCSPRNKNFQVEHCKGERVVASKIQDSNKGWNPEAYTVNSDKKRVEFSIL